MTRERTVATVATAAAAAAIAAFFATGQMPDAPVAAVCSVSWAAGPCEAAVALSAGDVACEPGRTVTLPVEVAARGDEDLDAPGAVALPPAFVPIESTTRIVECSTFTRPSAAVTVVPASKHGVLVGSTYCPPIAIAGLIPEGCE